MTVKTKVDGVDAVYDQSEKVWKRGYNEDTIENNFKYHKPMEKNIEKFKEIRDEGRTFAKLMMDEVPECPERTLAFRKIEEAVMWANAGLARNQHYNSFKEAALDLGFKDHHEMIKMINAVDLSSPEKVNRFKAWQNDDGKKPGLQEILDSQ